MKKQLLFSLITMMLNPLCWSQEQIQLWGNQTMPYTKPHNIAEEQALCWGQPCTYKVVKPTLTIYSPQEKQSDSAVIILPGGGYELLAMQHEGHSVAKALADKGITAAVLKYRLPNPMTSSKPELVPLSDLRQSISLLHSQAKKYGINENKIGVLGFSAGAHLATVASLWPAEHSWQQPDFSLLIYGVTRLNQENLSWLEKSLYFRPLSKQEKTQNRLLEQVTAHSPPAFLVHAMDDDVCHYSETTLYAEALTRSGVAVETHLYAKGGHGFGLGRRNDGTDQWLELAINWIKRL